MCFLSLFRSKEMVNYPLSSLTDQLYLGDLQVIDHLLLLQMVMSLGTVSITLTFHVPS